MAAKNHSLFGGALQGRLCKIAEYHIWINIIRRCEDKRRRCYRRYGGRGIRVCAGWRTSFESFLDDLGHRPSSGHSIDRRDSTGHYSCGRCAECIANGWPANCRWATRVEQANNKRNNVVVAFNGVSLTLKEWSRRIGIPYSTLLHRHERGWSAERMLTTASRVGRNQSGEPKQLTHDGRTMSLQEWAAEVGVRYHTLKRRLLLGWPVERALTTPVGSR